MKQTYQSAPNPEIDEEFGPISRIHGQICLAASLASLNVRTCTGREAKRSALMPGGLKSTLAADRIPPYARLLPRQYCRNGRLRAWRTAGGAWDHQAQYQRK